MQYATVIRTKNSEKTIGETLSRILSQTIPPAQIVIVDNQSTDRTLEIATGLVSDAQIVEYPVNTSFNYSKALNLGLSVVEADFTLVISSHVYLLDDSSLETALTFLEANRRCAAVRLGLEGINEQMPTGQVTEQAGGCSNRSQVIRTNAWKEIPFQEWIPTCEDKLWEKELCERGWRFAILPQVATYHNPFMNTAKECQEFYVMARYIEPRKTSFLHAAKLFAVAGRELFNGRKQRANHFYQLASSKVMGGFRFQRDYRSDSYRNQTS